MNDDQGRRNQGEGRNYNRRGNNGRIHQNSEGEDRHQNDRNPDGYRRHSESESRQEIDQANYSRSGGQKGNYQYQVRRQQGITSTY